MFGDFMVPEVYSESFLLSHNVWEGGEVVLLFINYPD